MDKKQKTSILNKKINLTDLKVFFAALLIPSAIFQVAYSSVLLIIISILTIYNFIFNHDKIILTRKKTLPFLIYFCCILISIFIDAFYGVYGVKFISKNIIILIIPLFIFSSNFKKKDISKVLNLSAYLISFFGLIILFFWFFGYHKYIRTNEFGKQEWVKNEIIVAQKNEITKVIIPPSSKKPTLKKTIYLGTLKAKDSIIRELIIKKTTDDLWILIRGISSGEKKRAWLNAKNGFIGFKDGKQKIKTELLKNDFYKFSLKNSVGEKNRTERFDIFFVSGNKSYTWNASDNLNGKILNFKDPNCRISKGKDLLKPLPLTSYGLTYFSFLKQGTHKTYIGLVFLFSLIILLYNTTLKNTLKLVLITINLIVLFTLASKAIILSIIIILFFFLKKIIVRYKLIFLISFAALFFIKNIPIIKNMHMFQRFDQMFQTITKINKKEDLNVLDKLSTNSRINIYKDYIQLTKQNIWGYGYLNGKKTFSETNDIYFNSHNQFLQIFFNSGIIGFCLFIVFLSIILFKFEQKKELFLFILILYFNFLFESILYRQWGLIIVSVVFSIYIQNSNNNKWYQ